MLSRILVLTSNVCHVWWHVAGWRAKRGYCGKDGILKATHLKSNSPDPAWRGGGE